MKKTIYYLAIMLFALSFSSCITSTTLYTDVTKRAKVEDVIKLKEGMDYTKINSVLQTTPFNVYFLEEDGRSLWEYRYYTQDDYSYNTYKKSNTWRETYKSVFVLLKDGKLVSYVTTPGLKQGYGIIVTLNTINYCLTEKELKEAVKKQKDCDDDGIIILVKNKEKFINNLTK